MIRAHEAQLDGYKMHRWNGPSDFPVVITIFSAPNYCDVYNNKGAIIKFEVRPSRRLHPQKNTLNIQQFNYTQHPYILPNFMDIFTWSIPFVSEKVTEMLYHVLRQGEAEEVVEDKPLPSMQEPVVSKVQVLKNKVKFVSKMMRMFKTLRYLRQFL